MRETSGIWLADVPEPKKDGAIKPAILSVSIAAEDAINCAPANIAIICKGFTFPETLKDSPKFCESIFDENSANGRIKVKSSDSIETNSVNITEVYKSCAAACDCIAEVPKTSDKKLSNALAIYGEQNAPA